MENAISGIADTVIRWDGCPPTDLIGARAIADGIKARPGALLATVPGIGRFYCHSGSTIEVAAEEDADPDLVRLWLQGTARGAIIHQRGELPLHAASFVPPDGGRAIAICGHTGAGKSTLGFELSRRGWQLLADDVTRVGRCGQRITAWPSRNMIKLTPNACASAGLETAGFKQVARAIDKYYVPVPARQEPAELAAIFELSGDTARKISGAGEKMALLARHTFRPGQIRPLGIEAEHMRIVAATASACLIFQLPGNQTLTPARLADLLDELRRS